MSMTQGLAPGVSATDRVVLFDGVCKLCGAWARFLIRYDLHGHFKLASVQSPEGQAILAWYGLPTDYYETMLLVEGSRIYTKSEAFMRIMARLPWPWPLASIGRVLPGFLRDWLYDRIALNRYALFGRHDVCVIPTPDHEARFLHGKEP
jgi:predicted DCC family thiol-disulfide oxidoreductase YuxK